MSRTRLVINCETGEETIIEMTPEEEAEHAAIGAEHAELDMTASPTVQDMIDAAVAKALAESR